MMGHEGTGRDGDNPLDPADLNDTYDEVADEVTEDVEELSLTDEDERLPWLESAEYDDVDEGVDTGRIIGFILFGLLALGVLIGGIWFLTNRGADPELVADGSTIEAPEGPVKERPEDPGGRTFEGTGNVAPGVGEGQTREGRLADSGVPKPDIDRVTTNGATGPVASPTATPAAETGGVGVQVGAYSTRASAETGWSALGRQTDAIKGFKYRIVEGKADIGTVYRLQAVAGDQASAKKLCDALRSDGLACQVK